MATTTDTLTHSSPVHRLGARGSERLISAVVGITAAAALVWGWLHRADKLIDPEEGLGYALGIIGGSMMLVLLAYPLRKRQPVRLRSIGSVGLWFRFHMLLGLAGPLAILYHSRFTFGALNSAVALISMIVVAGSGLIGRFLYSRVHRGYSDRKLEIRALKQDMGALLGELEQAGVPRERILEKLQPFEECAIHAGAAFWSSASAVLGLGLRTRIAYWRLTHKLTAGDRQLRMRSRVTLGEYLRAVRRAAEFAFYDRLLRLWHLLHLPLFMLLVAAAILHIVAVHMY